MKLVRKIAHPFFRRYYNWYHRKPRIYKYKNVEAAVYPGIFSPYFTTSTKILLGYLAERNLNNVRFLELGCGCGIISVFAASKNAVVTATDINPLALRSVAESAKKNKVEVTAFESNLLQNIDCNNFDLVIINPPYYPKQPSNINEQAWYCGEKFEYFEKLFLQMKAQLNSSPEILMILSEDCNIEEIKTIAAKNKFELVEIRKIRKWNEVNFVFGAVATLT